MISYTQKGLQPVVPTEDLLQVIHQREKLLLALMLAKEMMISNGLILPHTFEVIDAAIALVTPPTLEEED